MRRPIEPSCFPCHPTARDFRPFHHLYADLDFGNDVYLIEKGKVMKNLQHTESWYNLLAPLSASVSEVQFTWRSHPLVSWPAILSALSVFWVG